MIPGILRSKIQIHQIIHIIKNIQKNKGRIFFLGVGGSAANCSHAVNDFRKILGIECYTPVDNVSELTARTNDEGWETVFEKWLQTSNLCKKDLIFLKTDINYNRIFSYIQIRGSVPVYWTQKPNLSYSAPILVEKDSSKNLSNSSILGRWVLVNELYGVFIFLIVSPLRSQI